MFNVYHNRAPSYLSQDFKRIQSQHQHATRNAQHGYVVPRCQGISRFNFSYLGAKAWNSLPVFIKTTNNKLEYKKIVKSFIKQTTLATEQSGYPYH